MMLWIPYIFWVHCFSEGKVCKYFPNLNLIQKKVLKSYDIWLMELNKLIGLSKYFWTVFNSYQLYSYRLRSECFPTEASNGFIVVLTQLIRLQYQSFFCRVKNRKSTHITKYFIRLLPSFFVVINTTNKINSESDVRSHTITLYQSITHAYSCHLCHIWTTNRVQTTIICLSIFIFTRMNDSW